MAETAEAAEVTEASEATEAAEITEITETVANTAEKQQKYFSASYHCLPLMYIRMMTSASIDISQMPPPAY